MIKRISGKEPLLLAIAPIVACWLILVLAETSLFKKMNVWLQDTQQYLFAEEIYFDDVVFIDIDDASLFELEPELGVWPYKRDVYAQVLDYLTEKGADRIVFDLLLSETREGDQALAQAVKQHQNAVFIASSPVYASQKQYQDLNHQRLLEQLSWQASPQLPTTPLKKLVLPAQEFILRAQNQANVGVVDVFVDQDGTFRRLPAVYQVGESYFPSVPLLLQQKQRGKLDFDHEQQTLILGDKHWPIDEKGMLNIYFPRNANSVLSMSFYPVVEAARGVFKPDNEDEFFQGKTVFISSSAFKSDLVNTPRGMMSGSYFLAIVYQNLKHNLLLKAPKPWLDQLLLTIALLPLCLFPLFFHHTPGRHLLLLIGSAATIWGLNSAFLALSAQQSTLLLPLLILGAGYFLQSIVLAKLSIQRNESLSRKAQHLKESNEELAVAASTDALTQLLNRRAFLQHFDAQIEQYQRDKQPFTVAIMDLDHFKSVNDDYGHDIGDQVLRAFAEVVSSSIRQHDIAARWGGEEFVLLLPDLQEAQAFNILDSLRQNTSNREIVTEQGTLKVTVSIGVVQFSEALNNAEDTIALADKALYKAKDNGRNCICLNSQIAEHKA
ncbi:diguanylate cyclase [Oceanospirillum beijerinckii]|uniref:diguanylate cyclase n=1 Tax=Oceanospirillum beijerinckii TaxID=64976 RepID=UPI000419D70C|nr:diguanylate cyclase [Oceanospirillum beijerinckii]